LAKGLTVGGTASYVFGSIEQRVATQVAPANVTDLAQLNSVVLLEQVRYSDFTFRGAAHYRGTINTKLNYNLGGVYSFRSSLNGTRNTSLDREDVAGNLIDRIQLEANQKGEARVPALAQFGISIDNNKNFSANLDVAHQQWSKFRSFGIAGGPSTGVALENTVRVGLGGEYTPDPTSVDSYFKRVTYRAGISAGQMPYRPDGQTLYDRAISWGFTMPVPSASALEAASMNLAFTYGQRGNTDISTANPNGNVREDYVRVQVGLSLNNRWFIKRRIE
jgi:long-subunit fatty acid transport protein